jgi:hypothetical protein
MRKAKAETIPAQLEKVILNQVLDLAKLFGWRSAHFRPAMTKWGYRTAVSGDGKGFVDVVLVRERVIWIECKRVGEPLKPEQELWRDALLAAGQEYYIWTPDDFEEVAKILQPTSIH